MRPGLLRESTRTDCQILKRTCGLVSECLRMEDMPVLYSWVCRPSKSVVTRRREHCWRQSSWEQNIDIFMRYSHRLRPYESFPFCSDNHIVHAMDENNCEKKLYHIRGRANSMEWISSNVEYVDYYLLSDTGRYDDCVTWSKVCNFTSVNRTWNVETDQHSRGTSMRLCRIRFNLAVEIAYCEQGHVSSSMIHENPHLYCTLRNEPLICRAPCVSGTVYWQNTAVSINLTASVCRTWSYQNTVGPTCDMHETCTGSHTVQEMMLLDVGCVWWFQDVLYVRSICIVLESKNTHITDVHACTVVRNLRLYTRMISQDTDFDVVRHCLSLCLDSNQDTLLIRIWQSLHERIISAHIPQSQHSFSIHTQSLQSSS